MEHPSFRLPSVGAMVGDYRIVGLIGDGGQGHVYRAEAFGRVYALKFLDPGLDQFGELEAQILLALKKLQHPGVVRFIACGRWPDPDHGLFYVVMEFVEGLTLYDYVMIHNPSARKVGELVLSLGRTLIAIQEAGVLHRDVKRENIMVRLPGEEPVVLDFGLGALTGARSNSGFGQLTGTLEYLSPEAWKHARDEEERYRPTAKDEQWALGVTFYWLLTDRLPFGVREDPLMTRRVLRETPKAPHVINPRAPPELGAICMRLLEKNPEDRYADLKEMCGELRRALETPLGVATWGAPLGQPDAPECRTTDIDATVLAEHGIDLALLKVRPPRRGRVIKLPEYMAPAPPLVPPPGPLPLPKAEDAAPAPGAATVAVVVPEPLPVEVPSNPVGWRQRVLWAFQTSARRAASWTMMLALGLVMVPHSVGGPPLHTVEAPVRLDMPAPWPEGLQPNGEVASFAPWQVGSSVQKLEIPLQAPESGSDAASTSASVVEATLPKDEPDVKNALKKVRKCIGVCCVAGAIGCVSNTTVVRSPPPPRPGPCPDRVVQEMERWGITVPESFKVQWPGTKLGEDVTVREGVVKLRGKSRTGRPKFREGVFEGKLFFGPDRVYGNFTKVTTPEGDEFAICAEFIGPVGESGEPMKEPSSGESAVIHSGPVIRIYF